jgi:hypothetical protein
MTEAQPDPVELAATRWSAFRAAADSRLLVWLGKAAAFEAARRALAMAIEADEGSADSLLVLTSPFEGAASYATALIEELEAWRAAQEGALAESARALHWHVPPPHPREADGRRLLTALGGLSTLLPGSAACLVAALRPAAIATPETWERWVTQLMLVPLPARLRVVVELEPGAAETIRHAAERAGHVVVEALGAAGPDDLEREMTALGLAMAAPDRTAPSVARAGERALRVAERSGRPDREATVLTTLAAAKLDAGEHEAASTLYRRAIAAARRARTASLEGAATLEIVGALGLGGALMTAERWAEAGKVYEATGELAAKSGDQGCAAEAWLLATQAHTAAADDAALWRASQQALTAAEALEPERRPRPRLTKLGLAMRQLLDRHYPDPRHRQTLDARLLALLGSDWDRPRDAGKPEEAAA